jgi:Phosphotransferase enzyme family.
MNPSNIIAFGRTAEILTYDHLHILKHFKSDMPLSSVITEYNNTKAVYELGIQCTKPIEVIDYVGRKGIIYERIIGKNMLSKIIENPQIVIGEAQKLASIHLDIHERSVENFPKQKEVLAEQIKNAPLISNQIKDRILNKLFELPDDTKLCHGDFHPDNIIESEDKDWVIDWMTGMQGNPAGDVARTYLLLKLGSIPEELPKEIQVFVLHQRNQIFENYMKSYLDKSAITSKEIMDWISPVAAARLCEWIPDEEKNNLVEVIINNL